jgi:hypothetical protein
VNSFLKHVHVIDYSREALLQVAGVVETFAEAENLPAHGAAVTVRRGTVDGSRPAEGSRQARPAAEARPAEEAVR